jgi:MFS transporter, FSR family, fosmidomycin resistance protein
MAVFTEHKSGPLSCWLTCGIGHFAVDFCCAYTMLFLHAHAMVADRWYFTVLVAYNLLAFGGQAPVGWLIDRRLAYVEGVGLGLALTTLGVALAVYQPFAALALLGVGNAIFHAGAGALVFRARPGQAGGPGLFVAPGGLGLITGILCGQQGAFSPLWVAPVPFILAVCSYRILYPYQNRSMTVAAGTWRRQGREAPVKVLPFPTAVLALLLAVVALRSFAGFALPVPWKEVHGGWLLAAAACAGKASGGFLADRFGWSPVCTSLLVAAALLSLGRDVSLPASCGALFCLQATTGVTLSGVQNLFPGRPAFAFGVPCLALLVGAAPFFLPEPMGGISSVLLFGLGLVTALSIRTALAVTSQGET